MDMLAIRGYGRSSIAAFDAPWVTDAKKSRVGVIIFDICMISPGLAETAHWNIGRSRLLD